MIDFKTETKDGDAIECDCCGSEAPVFSFSSQGPEGMMNKWLCELCSVTLAAARLQYPRQHDVSDRIVRDVAAMLNIIRSELHPTPTPTQTETTQ